MKLNILVKQICHLNETSVDRHRFKSDQKLFANYPFRCRKSPRAALLLTGCVCQWKLVVSQDGKEYPLDKLLSTGKPRPIAFGSTYPMGNDYTLNSSP